MMDKTAIDNWLQKKMDREFAELPRPQAQMLSGPQYAKAWKGLMDNIVSHRFLHKKN